MKPALFHQKWKWLGAQRDPDGQILLEKLGPPSWGLKDMETGGQRFEFDGGQLVRYEYFQDTVHFYGL